MGFLSTNRRDLFLLLGFAVVVLPGADNPAGCNLLAPIVLNPKTRLGAQLLQAWSDYSAFHPLPA